MPKGSPNKVRLNVELTDEDLFMAIKVAAVHRREPLRVIVTEALEQWLERQEDEDDRRVIAEREHEESIPWEEAKRLMQEARIAQGDQT